MKHISKDDGLPSNTIYDIYRDSKGFLWIGTDKGVVKYNGISFQTFTTSDGLPDNEIFFFQEDAYGRIWLATYNGDLCYYKNDTFHTAANTAFMRLPYKSSFIKYINPGPGKSVIIGFQDQRFFLDIDGEHISRINLTEIRKHVVPVLGDAVIRNVTKEGDGTYNAFRADGVFKITKNGQIDSILKIVPNSYSGNSSSEFLYTFCQNKNYYLNNNYIYNNSFHAIRKINFLIDSRQINKVFEFEDKVYMTIWDKGLIVNDITSFTLTDSVVLLKQKKTAAITNDEIGNVWVGTLEDGIYIMPSKCNDYKLFMKAYEGIAYYTKNLLGRTFFVSADNTVSSIQQNTIRSFFSYPINSVEIKHPAKPGYLLNNDGSFSFFYKNKFLRVKNVFDRRPEISTYLNRDIIDGFGGVFLANGKLVIEENSRLKYLDIDKLSVGRDILEKLSLISSYAVSERIYSVCQKHDESVWYASRSGIYKFANGVFSKVDSLSHIGFKQIFWHNDYLVGYTHDNKLLVCSFGVQKTVDTIPAYNCIWDKIYDLDSTHIIISSNKEYRIIELSKNKKPKAFVVKNDFLPHECESICADNEFCYFFKSGNITAVKIATLLSPVPIVRLLYESLSTLENNFREDSILSVSYMGGKNVSIYFSTLSFSEKSVAYQYSITRNGGDTSEWRNFNSSPLSLININYGNYIIRVRAITPTGEYSAPLIYSLNIRSPYWLSWWFLSACISLLLLSVWFIVRRRTSYLIGRRQKEYETEVRYMKSEYKALNALMNPHFIFNALNNVQGLVNSGDKRSANEYLRIFADLVRQNMHNVSMELIPMAKELELVRNYLLLEKLRFDNKLQYSIDIDDAIDTSELLIPPLVIQPLVENAIKHGILPLQSGDGELLVKVFERDELYVVEIWDNGVGFSSPSTKSKMHQSFGLENLRKRIDYLKQINNMEMELIIEERQYGNDNRNWTIVSVSFK